MATAPTLDEIKRAFLDRLKPYNLRPGHTFPLNAVNVRLQQRGFQHKEIVDALEVMGGDGWFDNASTSTLLKITALGFAEI